MGFQHLLREFLNLKGVKTTNLTNITKSRKLRGSTGAGRDRQNLLADYDRAKSDYPRVLQNFKSAKQGTKLIDSNSAAKIISLFNITDLDKFGSRKLGNTGITLSKRNNKFFLSK
jgi:hypothetical protein